MSTSEPILLTFINSYIDDLQRTWKQLVNAGFDDSCSNVLPFLLTCFSFKRKNPFYVKRFLSFIGFANNTICKSLLEKPGTKPTNCSADC